MRIIRLFISTLLLVLQLSRNFCAGLKPSPYQYGEDDGEPPASTNPSTSSNDNYTAGIQFMITRRMRRTLESELGYLETEVDSMEPQIAAVVIDRKLVRPLNGMPSSWKKSYKKPKSNRNLLKPIGNFANSIKKKIQNLFSSNIGKQIRKYAIPLAVLILAAPIATQQIPYIGNEMIKSINSMKENVINSSSSKKVVNDVRKTIIDNSSSQNNNNNNNNKGNIKSSPSTTTTINPIKVIEKQPFKIKTQPPIVPLPLPPQIKINQTPTSSTSSSSSSSPSSSSNKKSIDKVSFDKATSLSILDRIIILRHIIIGK